MARRAACLLLVSALCPLGCQAPIPSASHGEARSGQTAPAAQAVEPRVAADTGPAPGSQPSGFLGQPERVVIDKMLHGRLVSAKKGRGGRSLGFKLRFEDGTQAYYKPEQTFSGAHWNAELVAHYLDRALGLGRVPPVVGRRLPWAALRPAAGADKRVDEVIVGKDGQVRGALVHWLSKAPTRAQTPPGWENWLRLDPFPRWAITPYQRPRVYTAALRRRKELAAAGGSIPAYYDTTPTPTREDLPAALSDMIVLDHLTLNIDRWGGNNGNVLTRGEGGPLVFLDNGAGFSPGPHSHGFMDDRLTACQRFRRHTVDALRALDVQALRARLARDPLAPLLDDHLVAGVAQRRAAILAHVDALRQTHGDAVLAW